MFYTRCQCYKTFLAGNIDFSKTKKLKNSLLWYLYLHKNEKLLLFYAKAYSKTAIALQIAYLCFIHIGFYPFTPIGLYNIEYRWQFYTFVERFSWAEWEILKSFRSNLGGGRWWSPRSWGGGTHHGTLSP